MDVFNDIQLLLELVLSIGAFALVRRRAAHTRRQLVAAATIGGGVGGAMTSAFIALLGDASFTDIVPFALFGLLTGFTVGLCGVLALALGRWLDREP